MCIAYARIQFLKWKHIARVRPSRYRATTRDINALTPDMLVIKWIYYADDVNVVGLDLRKNALHTVYPRIWVNDLSFYKYFCVT